MAQLVSAEATIQGLTQQVEELGSSQTLARVRESYDSALAAAAHQHQEGVASLREELDSMREELESKVCGCLSVCLFHLCLIVCLSVLCLPVCLFVCSICFYLFVCLSVCTKCWIVLLLSTEFRGSQVARAAV